MNNNREALKLPYQPLLKSHFYHGPPVTSSAQEGAVKVKSFSSVCPPPRRRRGRRRVFLTVNDYCLSSALLEAQNTPPAPTEPRSNKLDYLFRYICLITTMKFSDQEK
jgi:hypothetical protein